MDFTFEEYGHIIDSLKKQNYEFTNYKDWNKYDKPVILRHDVDISLEKAYEMARFEQSVGVESTYFVLITGDFYNTFNKQNIEIVKKIADCGMDIGLHFDETIYSRDCDIVTAIEREIMVMEWMIGMDVESVSMHIPSQRTLEANYIIKGGKIINSYSNVFFKEFKYVSDSKMHWRENVYDVIESGKYQRIHLLTHPVWYNKNNMPMWDTVSQILKKQAKETYKNFEVHTNGVVGAKTLEECLTANDYN